MNVIIIIILLAYPGFSFASWSPANEYRKGEELLKELRKLNSRFEKIYKTWQRDSFDEQPLLPISNKSIYKESGIIPFNRNYILYTYDRSIPTYKEINSQFSIEMAGNELEPLSISLYALNDIKDLTVTIGVFKDKENNLFPPENITPYSVVSLPMAYSRKFLNRETEAMKRKIYEIQPTFLVQLKNRTIEKNKCLQIILDFKTTHEVSPGDYKGEVILKSKNRKPLSIPIELKVFDFALDNIPEWKRGLFQAGIPSVEVLKLQKEWGFNAIAYWWWKGGHFYFGNARNGQTLFKSGKGGIGLHLENMKKADFGPTWVYFLMHKGFSKAVENWTKTKYPSKEYKKEYLGALKELFEFCKKNGYSHPIIAPTDEPTGYDLKRFLKEAYWISEEFDFAKIYTVVYQKEDILQFKGKKHLNLWVSNNPSPQKMKAATENKSELGIYRGVHIKRPIADTRFQYGFKSFWFNAVFTFGWANNFIKTDDPFFDFVGKEGFGHSVIYEMPSGVIPTLNLLALREAIDDRRYIGTLMKKRESSAEKFINKIRDKFYSKITPKGPYFPTNLPDWVDPWTYGQIIQTQNPVFLNKWRREISEEILSL